MNDDRPSLSRRTWLQFGLRSSLIGITLVCVGFFLFDHLTQQNRHATEFLKATEASFRYQRHRYNVSPPAIEAQSWQRSVLGDDYFHQIIGIDLGVTQLRRQGFWQGMHRYSRGMSEVNYISIWGEQLPIEADAVEALEQLPKLDTLYFYQCELSSQTLQQLGDIKSLRNILIREPPGDFDFMQLQDATLLETLVLSNCNLTLEDAERLRERLRKTCVIVHDESAEPKRHRP